MDPLIVVLTISVSIIALVMTVAGIQLILTLHEARKTLKRINSFTGTLENIAQQSIGSIANLGGMFEGAKTGMKVAQSFIGWLNRENA